jgi:uncharacterized repeat protein (TIGR03803 family)
MKQFSTLTACIVIAFCVATTIASSAQTFTSLHSFDSTDGQFPELLVQATNGNLYATTAEAGANGFGTVFEITPGGTFTLLDSFDAADGEYPYGAALVQAANGDFYGTLQEGGNDLTLCGGTGCGTFFKMNPAGDLTTVYNFCSQSNCTDGSVPLTGLALADGEFYGTTSEGGANCVSEGGCGTVFKITSSGTLTTLYSFCVQTNCTDGFFPGSWLVQAPNGDFYGTTLYGGANCVSEGGCGTVFKITPSGTLTTLYNFCAESNCTDGSAPRGLLLAANGDFYGTTRLDGANSAGTIFKMTLSGTLTTVYSFSASDEFGFVDIQATDGNFYGTTHAGGANNAGTVFKMTPSGTLTTLYSFCAQSGCADGSAPVGLLQDTNGKFYGGTETGGTSSACTGGCGTIYSLAVGLGPFVEPRPSSGGVGAPVKILGTNLTGATSVTFNGTAAAFTVMSSSEISTTVPTGATTGAVEVVTPTKTLKSNVSFRVP